MPSEGYYQYVLQYYYLLMTLFTKVKHIFSLLKISNNFLNEFTIKMSE